MPVDPPAASAPPATDDLPRCLPATKPAASDPTAAAALQALTDDEAAHVAAQLARTAFPNPKPAFVGLSVSMMAPGLFHAERIKIEAGTSTSSTVTPERMEAGKQKLAEYLAGTTSLTLGLSRLDVRAGSSLEGVFRTKWASLLLHTVTPQDWAGDRAVAWGDLKAVAAYGVPLVAEVEEGTAAAVSAAAAVVPAVSESVASATASAGVPVPCSDAAVAAVKHANELSMRRAGLKKLLGAVKLIMPLVVAAVAASSFAGLV